MKMKMNSMLTKTMSAGLACAALFAAAPAGASEELFKKSNCMACHAIDQKRVGPSMKEVAAKYSADGAAAGLLAQRIRAGSVGVWGQMPMPPQAHVSEADARTLAEYILTVK
jgi:cytochrome c